MSNVKFFPPQTLADVEQMDVNAIIQGYLAGLHDEPEPKDSRAKWTGWRNGMVDSGRAEVSRSQRRVAHQYSRVL